MPHEGERALRRAAGVAVETDGPVRRVMPPGLATWLAQEPFLFLSAADRSGDVWTTVVSGSPGFLEVPREDTLVVRGALDEDDPLTRSLRPGVEAGALGLRFQKRQRARINGTIVGADADGVRLRVREAYGNCPKYIRPRTPTPTDVAPGRVRAGRLEPEDVALVSSADTMLVGSIHKTEGADTSHRGGPPGFVRVLDDATLAWSDFRGNDLFQTLGNIHESPATGLLFIDFATGDLLHLTGDASVHDLEGNRETRFRIRRALRRPSALPFAWV